MCWGTFGSRSKPSNRKREMQHGFQKEALHETALSKSKDNNRINLLSLGDSSKVFDKSFITNSITKWISLIQKLFFHENVVSFREKVSPVSCNVPYTYFNNKTCKKRKKKSTLVPITSTANMQHNRLTVWMSKYHVEKWVRHKNIWAYDQESSA